MVKPAITTTISHKELHFKVGSPNPSFEVIAVNESDRFATFQLELLAPGTEALPKRNWYELAPEVSTKKPPGDRTHFRVTITDTPIPGFSGVMILTIRTFSLELGEDRKILRLTLESDALVPLKVELPVKQFQALPLDSADIPVRVYNPGQQLTDVTLSLRGIPINWLSMGMEQRLRLEPGESLETHFLCALPDVTQTLSDRYPFSVEARAVNTAPTTVKGNLDVMPTGGLEFNCEPAQHQIPPRHGGLHGWWSKFATYKLQMQSETNVVQEVSVAIAGQDAARCAFQLLPDRTTVKPGETLDIALTATTPRPWLGLPKHLLFDVTGQISDSRVDLRHEQHTLKLKVLPLLPLWLQILPALLLLYVLWAISWLNPTNPLFTHRDKVNSVQFNGTGEEIVSGSDDQTLLHWRSDGFVNPLLPQQLGTVGRAAKSVRVVRYRPLNNDAMAAGLENGEIKLWQIDGSQSPTTLSFQKADRVLGLEFTRDARFLFSGHGSGLVLRWDLTNYGREASPPQMRQPVQQKQFDFAIYSTVLVGDADQTLAIAGRYNKLALWNWTTNQVKYVPYRVGGQDDYITSVVSAKNRPYLIATSDNQGYISVWNLQSCLAGDRPCERVDEWRDGHGGKPVRSVALSNFGCYLVSGGADGTVKLWSLTSTGKRIAEYFDGISMQRSEQPFNSVDIKVTGRDVLTASGNDDHLVRFSSHERLAQNQCDSGANP